MEQNDKFLVEKGVWSDYPQLEKQGYAKVFVITGDSFPAKMEKTISIPFKIGFVFNNNITFALEDYKEKSVWVPKQKINQFYQTDFYKLLGLQHPENSKYIVRALKILTNFGIKWDLLEAIYKNRFYNLDVKGKKLQLMFNNEFKSVTIWDQKAKDKLSDTKIDLKEGWDKKFKIFIENLLIKK